MALAETAMPYTVQFAPLSLQERKSSEEVRRESDKSVAFRRTSAEDNAVEAWQILDFCHHGGWLLLPSMNTQAELLL